MPPAEKAKAKADPKADPKAAAKKKATKDADVEEKKEKMQPPDKDAYDANINAKNAEIEKLQRDMNAIQKKLQEKSTDKDGFYEKKAMLAAKMATYGEQIKRLNDQRAELRKQFSAKSTDQKNIISHLRQTEQSITFKTESELDARISQIEWEMHTNTMTLQEEKKKVQEICALKKQKPKINAQAERLDSLKKKKEELSDSTAFDSIKDQITAVNQKADVVWAEKEKVKLEYLELIELHKAKTETKDLDDQKQGLRKKISELVAERNALRKQYDEEKIAFRNYKREEQRAMADKRAAETTRRREEYEKVEMAKKEDKLFVQPHLAEVALLEQTITFCKNLLPKETEAEKIAADVAHTNPEGYKVLKKKDERDEEFFSVATKKKGPTKKNRAAPSNVIKHDAYTFRLFDALGTKAPSSVDQVADTMAELQAKLDKYNAEIATWQEKKDDGRLVAEFHEENAKKVEEKKAKAQAAKDEVEGQEIAAEGE